MIELPKEFYFDVIQGGTYDRFPAGVYIHTKIAETNLPENRKVRLEEHRLEHQKTREFKGFTPIIRDYRLTHEALIRGDGWAYDFPKFTDLDNAGYPQDENFVGVPNLEEAFRLLQEEVAVNGGNVNMPYYMKPAGKEAMQELKRLRLE